MRSILLFLILLNSAGSQAAPYYKYENEEGETAYSDDPPYAGAEVKNTPKLQTTPAVKYKPKPKPKPKQQIRETKYLSFAISKPADNATIRNNPGNVSISLKLTPELNLQDGHTINIYLDGKLVKKRLKTLNITLDNVDRGSHSVKAEVRNKEGKILKSSASPRFHLHRISKLHNQPNAFTPPPVAP